MPSHEVRKISNVNIKNELGKRLLYVWGVGYPTFCIRTAINSSLYNILPNTDHKLLVKKIKNKKKGRTAIR